MPRPFKFVTPRHEFKLKLVLEFQTRFHPSTGGPGKKQWVAKWTQSYLTEADRQRAIQFYTGKRLNRSTRYTAVEPI